MLSVSNNQDKSPSIASQVRNLTVIGIIGAANAAMVAQSLFKAFAAPALKVAVGSLLGAAAHVILPVGITIDLLVIGYFAFRAYKAYKESTSTNEGNEQVEPGSIFLGRATPTVSSSTTNPDLERLRREQSLQPVPQNGSLETSEPVLTKEEKQPAKISAEHEKARERAIARGNLQLPQNAKPIQNQARKNQKNVSSNLTVTL